MAGGQLITSAQGNLSVDRQHGVAASFFQGATSLVVTIALAGQAIACSQGVANPNSDGTVALTGKSATVSQQTIAPSWEQALSGSGATFAGGTLTLVINPSTSGGQVVTSGAGTVTASGSNLTVNITGEEFAAVDGSLSSGSTLLSGAVSSSASGTQVPFLTLAISGQVIACDFGVVSPNQEAVDSRIDSALGSSVPSSDVALTGSAIAAAQGSVGITGDVDIPLTGSESTSAQGAFGIDESYSLIGQSVTGAQYPFGAPGTAELSGSSVAVSTGTIFTTGDRTSALIGQSVTAQDGYAVTSYLAFAIGQQLQIDSQEIGPRSAALAGSLVNAAHGHVSVYSPQSLDELTGGWGFYKARKKQASAHVLRGTYSPPTETVDADLVSKTAVIVKPAEKASAIDVETIVQMVEKRQAAREERRSKSIDAQLKAYYAAEDHRKAMEKQQAEAAAMDAEQQRLAEQKLALALKAEQEALAEVLLLAS